MGEPSAFGRRLIELRHRAKLTQRELATRSGVSWETIAKVETGQVREPRLGTLRTLARALGVTLDCLAEEQ